jgi:hypothetical protein
MSVSTVSQAEMQYEAVLLEQKLDSLSFQAETQLRYVCSTLENRTEVKDNRYEYAVSMNKAQNRAYNLASQATGTLQDTVKEFSESDLKDASLDLDDLKGVYDILDRYREERRRFEAVSEMRDQNDVFEETPADVETVNAWDYLDDDPVEEFMDRLDPYLRQEE